MNKLALAVLILIMSSNVFANSRDRVEVGFSFSNYTGLFELSNTYDNSWGGQVEVTFPYYFNVDVLLQSGYSHWSLIDVSLNQFRALAGFRLEVFKQTQTAVDLGLALHLIQGNTEKPLLLSDKESDFGLEYGIQILKVDFDKQWISLSSKIIQLWTKPKNSLFLSSHLTWGWSW
jgi:hypothetical protein